MREVDFHGLRLKVLAERRLMAVLAPLLDQLPGATAEAFPDRALHIELHLANETLPVAQLVAPLKPLFYFEHRINGFANGDALLMPLNIP